MNGLGLLVDQLVAGNDTIGLILLAMVPCIVAVLIFWAFSRLGKGKPITALKWLALIPIVIGLWISFPMFLQVVEGDPLYGRYYGVTRRFIILHWVIVVLPILTGIGLGIVSLVASRRSKDDESFDF